MFESADPEIVPGPIPDPPNTAAPQVLTVIIMTHTHTHTHTYASTQIPSALTTHTRARARARARSRSGSLALSFALSFFISFSPLISLSYIYLCPCEYVCMWRFAMIFHKYYLCMLPQTLIIHNNHPQCSTPLFQKSTDSLPLPDELDSSPVNVSRSRDIFKAKVINSESTGEERSLTCSIIGIPFTISTPPLSLCLPPHPESYFLFLTLCLVFFSLRLFWRPGCEQHWLYNS